MATTRKKATENKMYIVGDEYITACNIYVRSSAGGAQTKYADIKGSLKNHCYADKEGNAVLKAGTPIFADDVKTIGTDVYIKTSAGYICGYLSAERFKTIIK